MLKLVYSCLALSAVALVVLIVSAAKQPETRHDDYQELTNALVQTADVLAADRTGAITQTGNGVVSGYRRGSIDPVWTVRFDRFTSEGDPPAIVSNEASARCAGDCPSALVATGSRLEAYGGASRALTGQLAKQGVTAEALRDVIDRERAVALVAPVDATGARRLSEISPRGQLQMSPTTPEIAPSAVYTDAAGTRAISGADDRGTGILERLVRSGGQWREAAPSLRIPSLQNLCISDDGRWVGAVGRRFWLMSIDDPNPIVTGNPVPRGNCRADSRGFTFVVNRGDQRGTISAVRLTHDGRRIWAQSFGRQQLISPPGSPLIVVHAQDNTLTAVDAATGVERLKRRVDEPAFVAADGAIVTANRKGQPSWVTLER